MEFSKGGVRIACVLLCAFQLFSCPSSTQASDLFKRAEQFGVGLANTMEQFYQSRSLTKIISPTFDRQKISDMVSSAKVKVKTMVTETKNKLKARDKDTVERVANGMVNSMKGLVGIVNGIKHGDWVEGVQGALGLVAAVAALAPPGIGTLISGVLSAISTFLGLFGGSQTESQEAMVKRVVETAISEFRNKDMKEDVEGVQHVYQSLSTSIQQFRESENLTAAQANELFITVFQELSVFGRLKGRFAELCAKPDTSAKASTCIDFTKLYAELSILRQLIMTDLASLLSEPRINLETSAQNILKIIRKEQESDLKTLSFLGNPVSNPSKRLAFATMFGNPEKYSTLISYLNSLHDEYDFGFWDDSLIICTETMLKGECVGLDKRETENKQPNFGEDFNDQIKSFFVPLSGKVVFWEHTNYAGKEYGPFKGPALHGFAVDDQFSSLSYSTTEEANDKGSIRFCEGESLNPETRCDYWDIPKDAEKIVHIDLSSYHGHNWEGKIGSFYLPPGSSLKALSSSEIAYGKYIGPHLANKVCKSQKAYLNDWKTVIIEKVALDARSMVEYCDEEDLQGHCFRSNEVLPALDKIYGQCDFTSKIQSIKLPAGHSVRGYMATDHKLFVAGPYFGPVTIGKVDKAGKWKSVYIASDAMVEFTKRTMQGNSGQSTALDYKHPGKKIDWKEFDRNQTAALWGRKKHNGL